MIKKIEIKDFAGYIPAKSSRYQVQDVCTYQQLHFVSGVNILAGEIDSGNWGVSYAISMWNQKNKDFILTEKPQFFLDDKEVNIEKLSSISCYMDKSYRLFQTRESAAKMIKIGLRKSQASFSQEYLRETFGISKDRFYRPLSRVGNEIFRCMAAIGIAWGKELFCFPWFSKRALEYYGKNLIEAMEQLSQMEKIVIAPFEISLQKTGDGSISLQKTGDGSKSGDGSMS